ATQPKIYLSMDRCDDEAGDTVLHELFHLAGFHDETPAMDKAFEQSASCSVVPAQLNFENPGEGFINDFQVQTRIFLFGKVREDAEKWGWTDGEKAFFLGAMCAKMGDKYCARRYFQTAAEGHLSGMVEMPEGGDFSWPAL